MRHTGQTRQVSPVPVNAERCVPGYHGWAHGCGRPCGRSARPRRTAPPSPASCHESTVRTVCPAPTRRMCSPSNICATSTSTPITCSCTLLDEPLQDGRRRNLDAAVRVRLGPPPPMPWPMGRHPHALAHGRPCSGPRRARCRVSDTGPPWGTAGTRRPGRRQLLVNGIPAIQGSRAAQAGERSSRSGWRRRPDGGSRSPPPPNRRRRPCRLGAQSARNPRADAPSIRPDADEVRRNPCGRRPDGVKSSRAITTVGRKQFPLVRAHVP